MIVCLLLLPFFIENALHLHVPLCMSPSSALWLPLAWNQTMKMAFCQRAVLQKYCRRNQTMKMASASQDMQLPSMCLLYDCTHIILLHVLAVQLALPRPNQTAFCCPFPLTCDEFSGTGLSRFPIVVLHACTCWHQLYFSIASCTDGTSMFFSLVFISSVSFKL